MRVELPYGTDTITTASIDWVRCLGVLDIADTTEGGDAGERIREALRHPIGMAGGLFEPVNPGERVAIVVSDAFRNTRADMILPEMLSALGNQGVRDEDIFIVFATGSHRPPTPTEQERIVGRSVYQRLQQRLYNHDPNDKANLVFIGTTKRGTPVWLNKRVHEADRIYTTGGVVLHYFGGFGGGRKSIVPGISGTETISANHARNLHPSEDRLNPAVRIGALDGNPVAEDMLEAALLTHVDGIVNTVLDKHGDIAGVFAGDMDAAHRTAAAFARDRYAVRIHERADLVIASSGGTRNFVQTHKALYNAYQAMKPGGRIILLAKCPEGLGGENYVRWLRLGSWEKVIAGLRQCSEINGQTALSTLEKGPSAVLLTELGEDDVALLGARKAANLVEAVALVRSELPEDPTCWVMPSAAYTVPFEASA